MCMAIQSFRPTVGGSELQLERLLPHLAARGVSVTVLTRAHRDAPRLELLVGGELRRTRLGGTSPLASLAFVIGSLRYVIRRRRQIDVLHSHGALSPGTVALGARLLGLPAMVKVLRTGYRGDFDRLHTKPGGRLRARQLAKRVWFIAPSAETREELLARGVPATRIFTIPNGVDTKVFRPAAATERMRLRSELGLPGGILGISACRLEAVKQLDTLMHALEQVRELHLVIVGDGPQRRQLEALARRVGVEHRVGFAGLSNRVPDYLRASDAFFLPSRSEGMSNALLEAMACGLACIATPVGGTRELLREGRGIVAATASVSAWSEAMGRVVDDARLRRRMGALAARYARESLAIEATAERIVDAYRTVLQGQAADQGPHLQAFTGANGV